VLLVSNPSRTISGKSGVKAKRPTPTATAKEIIPAAEIVIGDGNAGFIEGKLESPTWQLEWTR
jgi:hypothetical protein